MLARHSASVDLGTKGTWSHNPQDPGYMNSIPSRPDPPSECIFVQGLHDTKSPQKVALVRSAIELRHFIGSHIGISRHISVSLFSAGVSLGHPSRRGVCSPGRLLAVH